MPAGSSLPPQLRSGRFAGAGAEASGASSDRAIRLVTIAPLVVVAALAGPQLAMSAAYGDGSYASLLLVCLLPFSLLHVWSGAHRRRPPGGIWPVGVMAIIVAAGLPLVGYAWLTTFAYLLASVLIVLPRRWSLPVAGLILLTLVPVSLWLSPRPNPAWTMIIVVERAGAIVVPVWLAGALRELRLAREELTTRAVLRERIRIDGELSRTVGESLKTIAAGGVVAGQAVASDPEAAAVELRALADRSRRTLAEARLLIREYQRVRLRAELETAVTLLTAAGVSARLVVPRELPQAAAELSTALRAAVDDLLRSPVPECVIKVESANGDLRLLVEKGSVVLR